MLLSVRSWQRLLVLGLWLTLAISFWLYIKTTGQPLSTILENSLSQLSSSAWGPVLLLGIFIVRPLFLLPVTILTVFAGFLFGAFWGSLYALIATLITAGIPYLLGRFFGTELKTNNKLVRQMRERSFDTILLSRLIFIPGDLVNYAAGFLKISFSAFILATALGGLPSLLVATLAGASIEGVFQFEGLQVNPWLLLASAALLLFSLSLSRLLRKRSKLNDLQVEE